MIRERTCWAATSCHNLELHPTRNLTCALSRLSHSAVLQPAGLKRDVLYCYDLELPADFVPKPLVRAVLPAMARKAGWGRGLGPA